MRLLYIDESGQAGYDGGGPRHFLLGGVIVPSRKWRAVDGDLRTILDAARPKLQAEIYSSLKGSGDALRRWAKRATGKAATSWSSLKKEERIAIRRHVESRLESDLEVHASDLFHGRDLFEGVTSSTRLKLAGDALGIVEDHKLHTICVVLDKVAHNKKYGARSYPADSWSFTVLADAFDKYLRTKCPGEVGMFIADRGGPYAREAGKDLRRFQIDGTPHYHNKCERIIDSIHFVDSYASSGVQLADLVVYLRRQIVEANKSVHVKPLLARFRKATTFTTSHRP